MRAMAPPRGGEGVGRLSGAARSPARAGIRRSTRRQRDARGGRRVLLDTRRVIPESRSARTSIHSTPEERMKIGVVFPQTEIGQDPAVIRDYAQAVEGLGYTHILAFDSVVGANPDRPGGWDSPFTYRHAFHEPFVLFGFCAGVTRHIELVTGVIILPQRQTALVAKQAAAVDVLSGGRLRLGVGVGWNTVEFEALGEAFGNRGRRIEEQIETMRLLWTRELVTYEGQWHRVPDAGINPLPAQRPVPVWMGGDSAVVLRRAARLA